MQETMTEDEVDKMEVETTIREATIVRKHDEGRARDENLAQVRKLIKDGLSTSGLVTIEDLQKLFNDSGFCQVLYALFNEGGDEPLEQSFWIEKMKAGLEVTLSIWCFSKSDISILRVVPRSRRKRRSSLT